MTLLDARPAVSPSLAGHRTFGARAAARAAAAPEVRTGPRGRFRLDWRRTEVEAGPGEGWCLRRRLHPDAGGSGILDAGLTISGADLAAGSCPRILPAVPGDAGPGMLEIPGPAAARGPLVQQLTWTFEDGAGQAAAPTTLALTLHGLGRGPEGWTERIVLSGAMMTSTMLGDGAPVEVGVNVLTARTGRQVPESAQVRVTLAIFAGGALGLRRELHPDPAAPEGAARPGPLSIGELVVQR